MAILGGITLFFRGESWFFVLFISISVIYLIITIYGSFQIKANYFLNSINKGVKDGIALSFDDGPDPETTPKILDILRHQEIKASFFVIGKMAEKYPELLKTIEKDGHIIANHSYDHNNAMGFFGINKLATDIEKCSGIIEHITGKKPLLFRPPFGVTNPRYAVVLKNLRLTSIGWSGRSFDTITNSKNTLLKRVKKSIGRGAILLFHDTQKVTLEILPNIIEYCKENGVKIVPLHELIEQEPYEKV